jgi:hypothetical protein
MSTVHIVVAGVDYEGSSPVKAFTDKIDAEQFKNQCYEYEQTKPAYPADGATPEEGKAWFAAHNAWSAAHPAGDQNSSSDYFSVIEVPLVTGGAA